MRIATKDAAERVAARYIPKGATEERHEDAQAVVYRFTNSQGAPLAMGYAGTAYKPAFHFRFQTEERRTKFIDEWLTSQRAAVATRADRKVARKAATHELKLGDIVYASWGYEQTNVDFYQVVRVVSAKTVEVRQVAQQTTETGFMSGTTIPLKDQFRKGAPVLSRRASGTSVASIGRSEGSASKWVGRPVSCSWGY
jgi:hypothetical protein